MSMQTCNALAQAIATFNACDQRAETNTAASMIDSTAAASSVLISGNIELNEDAYNCFVAEMETSASDPQESATAAQLHEQYVIDSTEINNQEGTLNTLAGGEEAQLEIEGGAPSAIDSLGTPIDGYLKNANSLTSIPYQG